MSIRSDIKNGVFYNSIAKYAGVISQIFTTAILARLLTPEEFGIAVAVIVIASFFTLLSESGFAEAVIQRKDLNDQDLYCLFIITIFLGLFFGLAFWLSGPIISNFYNNNEYNKITGYLSFSLLFNSWSTVPTAILFRDKRFKAISLTSLGVQIAAATFAIFLAWQGFSYYSIIFQSIFSSFLRFIIYFSLAPVKFYKRFSLTVLFKIFNYSIFKSLTDVLRYLSGNLDNIMIGKYLGATPLGFYDKAFKLMMLPINNLSTIVTPVLHPVLSNFQNQPDTIYNVSKKITKLFGILGIPASIFLFFTADEVIRIFFGNQWSGSVPPFQFLAIVVWVHMVHSGAMSIFLSLNKTNYLFISTFISAAIIILAISCGIFIWGSISGVAFFIAVAYIINTCQVYYFLIVKILNKSLLDYFSSLKVGILMGIPIFALNVFVYIFIPITNIYISFLVKLFVTLVVSGVMLYILNEFWELINLIKPKAEYVS